MIGVNVWWVYLTPQNIPRAISVLTLGNKVVLYCIVPQRHSWQGYSNVLQWHSRQDLKHLQRTRTALLASLQTVTMHHNGILDKTTNSYNVLRWNSWQSGYEHLRRTRTALLTRLQTVKPCHNSSSRSITRLVEFEVDCFGEFVCDPVKTVSGLLNT